MVAAAFALAAGLCTLFVTGCDFSANPSDTPSTVSVASVKGGRMDAAELFTQRDLTQIADTSHAERITVVNGQEIVITKAGIYVVNGKASDVTIVIKAKAEDTVQIVLDNVSLSNQDAPCIYSQKANKVFVTLVGDNSFFVNNRFAADVSSRTDGVIFSRTDLTCNGTGSLQITSPENGIVCKDHLKITGGIYSIHAASKAIEANDSVRIADGTFTLIAGTDGIHAENSDDDTLGYLYIGGGHFTVQAGDDGLHATSVIQIDRGELDIVAGEGMEGTDIQINAGTLRIHARDDGINAAHKSKSYTPTAEINGGSLTILMDDGDGDAIDSNGNIIINGGTIDITGASSFDCTGTAWFKGGKITVNGQPLDTIPNQAADGPHFDVSSH